MPADQPAAPVMRDQSNHHPWVDPVPAWIMKESAALSEAEVLEEQMLAAGILASLQDAPDNPDAKVEVPKSSVSSLRLVKCNIFTYIACCIFFVKLLTLFPSTVLFLCN